MLVFVVGGGGVLVDFQWQGVYWFGGVEVDEVVVEGGKEQWCGFFGYVGECQYYVGDDVFGGGRQYDFECDQLFGQVEVQFCFVYGQWYQFEYFFGGVDYDGNYQEVQCECFGEVVEVVYCQYQQFVGDQFYYDGGNFGQYVVEYLDGGYQWVVGVFGEEDVVCYVYVDFDD